jgi:hypothetical protein
VKLAIAAVIIVWLVYEFVMQVRLRIQFSFSWQEVMLVQIFLCLFCTRSPTQSASASQSGHAC